MATRLTVSMDGVVRAYLDELARWNVRLNLSAVPSASAWSRHIAESLSLLDVAGPPEGGSVVDVGSGAGIPGVVVAVARPDLHVSLLESDVRKSGFLVHAAGMLGLTNIVVLTERAEVAGRGASREAFDVALSRAAAPPAVLCELALPLVRVGGLLCALVGDTVAAVSACSNAAAACGGEARVEPGDGILAIRKVAPTSMTYPRRTGVPQRFPL